MNQTYNPYMKYNNINKMSYKQGEGDRFFLAAPFLFGALAGGAVASVARPRPVYVYPPAQAYPPRPYGYQSYSYYYPTY